MNYKIYDKIRALAGNYEMKHRDIDLRNARHKGDWARYEEDAHDYSQDYFTARALGEGNIKLYLADRGWHKRTAQSPIERYSATVYFSINSGEWQSIVLDGSNRLTIDVTYGDEIRYKSSDFWDLGYDGNNSKMTYSNMEATCEYEVFGNMESLFSGDNFTSSTTGRNLQHFFEEGAPSATILTAYPQKGDTPEQWTNNYPHYLVNAENLVFRLADSHEESISYGYIKDEQLWSGVKDYQTSPGCYMFAYCQNLVKAPRNVTLAKSGERLCQGMFSWCVRLKECRWVIDVYRYSSETYGGAHMLNSMFEMCISLVHGPSVIRIRYSESSILNHNNTFDELGSLVWASSTSGNDMLSMFWNCVSLVETPVIVAKIVEPDGNQSGSHSNPFWNCQSLERAYFMHVYWKDRVMQWTGNYNYDPGHLITTTGRCQQITSGQWSSNASSVGTIKVCSNILEANATDWTLANNIIRDNRYLNEPQAQQLIRYSQDFEQLY